MPAWAQEAAPDPTASPLDRRLRDRELDPATERAIRDGLHWLADEQIDRRGSWPSKPTRYQMSVTALAGLALLASGSTPEAGPHAENVRRAVLWVLDAQRRTGRWEGLLLEGDRNPLDREERSMHGHGFALLFLSEAYGEVSDPKLRARLHETIDKAVRLTERSISKQGGWYYSPADSMEEGGSRDEGSVTITQIQGLRSAHSAGVHVDSRVVHRAVRYIKRSQNPDGGIRYMLKWNKTSAALTAAGISVLQGAGEYHGEAIDKGYAFLRKQDVFDPEMRFFFYTHLYVAQANFQRGGPSWSSYYPKIRRRLIAMRRGGTSWDSPFGRSYGTAIALLILQLPRRYLPIHQR